MRTGSYTLGDSHQKRFPTRLIGYRGGCSGSSSRSSWTCSLLWSDSVSPSSSLDEQNFKFWPFECSMGWWFRIRGMVQLLLWKMEAGKAGQFKVGMSSILILFLSCFDGLMELERESPFCLLVHRLRRVGFHSMKKWVSSFQFWAGEFLMTRILNRSRSIPGILCSFMR